jgi:uncharacterized Zn finger protein
MASDQYHYELLCRHEDGTTKKQEIDSGHPYAPGDALELGGYRWQVTKVEEPEREGADALLVVEPAPSG